MTQTRNPFSEREPWELVADGYAAEAGLVMAPFSLCAIELARPAAEARIIDVAAGPGTLSLPLAPRVARIDAIDFSASMLAQLEQKARAAKLDNIAVQVGDGQELPYPAGVFDAGFSLFGLMFFPDRSRGFRELHRVLKPGGVAVVSSWAPVDESSLMTLMFGAIRAADPSRPAPQRDLTTLENPDVLAREMSDGGFERVAVHTHEVEVEPLGARELWERMVRSSAPLVLMRRQLGEALWKERAEQSIAYLDQAFASGPVRLTTKAHLAVGYKA